MNFLSYALGASGMLARAKNSLLNRADPPLIVLLYHRVADLPNDPQMLAVSQQNFRAQMRFIKDNYPLVRLDAPFHTIPCPAVAVTFDDGYADNYHNALHLLEEMEIPATFFISTGYIDGTVEFWWDDAERMLLESASLPPTLELSGEICRKQFSTRAMAERVNVYHLLLTLMKKLDVPQRTELLKYVQTWSGAGATGRETHLPLNYQELVRLAKSPWVTIGAHGITHVPLSAISPERQEEEIKGSKNRLEELTGRKVQLFSYPLGTKCDYTSKSVSLCREAGFIRAASNFPGQVHKWTDPFQLPRHLVRNWPLEEFRKRMQRFWTA